MSPQQASVNIVPISNILPNPLAGITTRPWDEVEGIPLPETASTASVNLGLVDNILPDPLAGITNVRTFPDHQAYHSTPHHLEAQKHNRLEGKKEMPWTPQQASVNLMPINNILPNPLAGITTRPGDEVEGIPLH